MIELDLSWAFPVTIHRVVVWDRKQSATDNNQINKLKLSFSDGTSTGSIDMISQGSRCADEPFAINCRIISLIRVYAQLSPLLADCNIKS